MSLRKKVNELKLLAKIMFYHVSLCEVKHMILDVMDSSTLKEQLSSAKKVLTIVELLSLYNIYYTLLVVQYAGRV